MSDEAVARYRASAHAMQSGVAMEMNYDKGPTEPKHLRVGVNSSMVEHSALVQLLFVKGVITDDEYHEAIAAAMKVEAGRYESMLSERLGTKVTLA